MKLFFKLALFVFFCAAAFAEDTRGYFFVAPGGVTASGNTARQYYAGGGIDARLWRWVGAGAELQAALPPHSFSSNVFGIFSLNGYFHPLPSGRALDPFVTMGYSLAFRTDTANMFNYGGGMNYWFGERIGLLLEVRDHTRGTAFFRDFNRPNPNVHYWGVRVGLALR